MDWSKSRNEGLVTRPCSGENKMVALGRENHEEIWGVCWKLNVGCRKEGKIIQW